MIKRNKVEGPHYRINDFPHKTGEVRSKEKADVERMSTWVQIGGDNVKDERPGGLLD